MSEMTIGDITGLLPQSEDIVSHSILEQGDIWFIDMGKNKGHEQNGFRPVLIISNNNHNAQSKTPIVCPCTTSEKKGKNRYHVPVGNWEKDGAITYANGSQVYSVSSERFKKGNKRGTASKKALLRVIKIVRKLIWVPKDNSTDNKTSAKQKQKQKQK